MSCGGGEAQIITTQEPIADGEWQCFRQEFTLLSAKKASLKIAADTKYWLWVNGELVVREGGGFWENFQGVCFQEYRRRQDVRRLLS